MFSSYVLYDTVAVEAVYFPRVFPPAGAAVTTVGSSSGATSVNAPAPTSALCGDDNVYDLTLQDILLHRLTERYVGRIIPSRGLCVAITEVLDYSASAVRGAAASAWLTATFGVCVLAPTPGTRLKARIASQTTAGVYLTMDLFVALPFLVPAEALVPGSRFCPEQGCWYLPLDTGGQGEGGGDGDDDDNGDAEDRIRSGGGAGAGLSASDTAKRAATSSNTYTIGAEVIVKVVSCTVQAAEADVVASGSNASSGYGGASADGPLGDGHPGALMELRGSFVGDALGPVSWFEEGD